MLMNEFLKFLEDNCPGDDAHSGCGEPNKPLLERCGMCASIHEAHLKEMNLRNQGLQKAARALLDKLSQSWVGKDYAEYAFSEDAKSHPMADLEKLLTEKRNCEACNPPGGTLSRCDRPACGCACHHKRICECTGQGHAPGCEIGKRKGPILFPEEIYKYPEEWVVLSSGNPIKMLGHGKTPEEAIVSAGVDRANPCGWALWYHDGFTGIRI